MRRVVFAEPRRAERAFVADALRQETVGGALLLAAAVIAMVWANSPWQAGYHRLLEAHAGPLSVHEWAADGLLTIFFFVAGLELKRELVVGSLNRLADALVPVAAAAAGMVVPALCYLAVNLAGGDPRGWAVPTATDIAFALAVLAVVGSALPPALRAFLLTLAVVDDLGAILIIAVAFTDAVDLAALAGAALLCAVYAGLQRLRVQRWVVYVPLAVATWWLVHESGVHATVAGVALGLLTRVRPDAGERHSPAE
ncbi:MAG: Na+/H+ antiporter NhaA, partial [Actinomycetota bacterium]|nr:Na+/H+ antiporter NhaA [Actinomycetota bacterium]